MRSNLRNQLRRSGKNANSFTGTILSIQGNRATVRLSSGGAVYKTLKYVGGPLEVGQVVVVDMTSDIPIIVAPGRDYSITSDEGFAIKEPAVMESAPAIDGQILRYAGGVLVAGYPFTTTGMNTCLSDSNAGDLIMYPNGTLEMDFTLPPGVSLTGINADVSIFWGTITLSASTQVNDLLFLKELTSSDPAIAIIGPTTGLATLKDVKGKAFNCGSGNAIGLYGNAGSITAETSTFVGESQNGSGYGVYQA